MQGEFLVASDRPRPRGVWVGAFHGFLDTPGANRWSTRIADTVLFAWLRFGIDFDRDVWWFLVPAMRIGAFDVVAGPSRWRSTTVLQLHYGRSRLPIRHWLYDEVQVVADDRIVGIGGTNEPASAGDHFWFTLSPYDKPPQ